MNLRYCIALLAPVLSLLAESVFAQYAQQGPKLVGTGAVGLAEQGLSVALSADGNSAIVGGDNDSSSTGAAWIWTRTAGVWTQQGPKLVGSGAVGIAKRGLSVALSADGNTAIVGGPEDNNAVGAAWIWTRTGGVWTQQGPKLVGTGAAVVGGSLQGSAVSLSADANTAIVGGPATNGGMGAAWIWRRTGGVWTQQGTMLVGSGAFGNSGQGRSVFLSGDGTTAIVGGANDNNGAGAAWIWTSTGGVWTQQGPKLVGSGAGGGFFGVRQGSAVSLSGDGNTAVVGGPGDDGVGAAWLWTRNAGVWTQQGPKLVSAATAFIFDQGRAVSLAADGNTALIAGRTENGEAGSASLWQRTAGAWTEQSPRLIATGAVGRDAQVGWSVFLSADATTAIVGGNGDNAGVGAAWVFCTNAPAPMPPVVVDVTGPAAPQPVGASVTITATFTDADANDTHTATVDWGDGTSESGAVAEAAGSGTVSATHEYTVAGVYTITATVMDNTDLGGVGTYQYIVVYDPSAGFVTGGGWITSPPGAYVANPSLTGTAAFGFVSKYAKHASVPSGNTEFQFSAANLTFHTTNIEWLVIAGPKAQYKGSGTLNGLGSYGFLLSATDGALPGGGGSDKFRIKIWEQQSGTVVYDNMLGSADTADPSTQVGGGNIVIHH